GSHTASGNPIGYVTNVSVNATVQWQSEPAVDGTYRAHIVDERCDFSFQVGWLYGDTLKTLHAAETALHVKLLADMPGIGSAGVLLYSGVIPSLGWNAVEGGVFSQSVQGF